MASSCDVRARSAACCMSRSDRKSTRLNSSHLVISYAVFCLKKKKKQILLHTTPLNSSHQAPSHLGLCLDKTAAENRTNSSTATVVSAARSRLTWRAGVPGVFTY